MKSWMLKFVRRYLYGCTFSSISSRRSKLRFVNHWEMAIGPVRWIDLVRTKTKRQYTYYNANIERQRWRILRHIIVTHFVHLGLGVYAQVFPQTLVLSLACWHYCAAIMEQYDARGWSFTVSFSSKCESPSRNLVSRQREFTVQTYSKF